MSTGHEVEVHETAWWQSDCEVHGSHAPATHSIAVHHIWPRGMGGPDVDALPDGTKQKLRVCPTGHVNIHALLSAWIKADGDPGKDVRRGFHRNEQKYAAQGFREWVAAGKPGHTTGE